MKIRNTLILGLLVIMASMSAGAYQFGTAWDESDASGTPTDAIYLAHEKDRGLTVRNVYIVGPALKPAAITSGIWNILIKKKRKSGNIARRDSSYPSA